MKIQEAIDIINNIDFGDIHFSDSGKLIEAINARELLVELAKGRIPKKPIDPDEDYGIYECPNCGGTIYATDELKTHKFCLLCGQAIDWDADGIN